MVTVTRTTSTFFRRTVGSATPTLTVLTIVRDSPATDTGSVMAAFISATALCGPMISTVAGSALRTATSKPRAGSPSTSGITGTVFVNGGSKVIYRVVGATCTTSTHKGA